MTTDYGLQLVARFSLAETLGRVHNEWRENAKLRSLTTNNRLKTKCEGQFYTKQTQNVFCKDSSCSGFDSYLSHCNPKCDCTWGLRASLIKFSGLVFKLLRLKNTSEANLTYFTKLFTSQLEGKPFVPRKSKEKSWYYKLYSKHQI